MSGIEAAATLVLQVDTNTAERQISEIEQKLFKLSGSDGTRTVHLNVAQGNTDASIAKVKTLEAEVAVLNAKLAGVGNTLAASYGQSISGFSYKLKQSLGDSAAAAKQQLDSLASAAKSVAGQQLKWSFKIDRNFAGQVTEEARKAFEASVQYDKAWVEAHRINAQKIAAIDEAAAKARDRARDQANNLELRVISAEESAKLKDAARSVRELNQAKNQANNLELRVIAAEELAKTREAEKAVKELNRAKNLANNLELRVIAAEEAGRIKEADRATKELARAKNLANSLELRVIAAEEAAKIAAANKALKELNQAKNQANNLELRLIAREEAERLRAAKKDAEDLAKWLALTEKQRASATLQAAKAHFNGGNQSLLPGVAGSDIALVSAQNLGSVQAAQQALDALSATNARVSRSTGSVTDKLKEQRQHMWDLHSAARGLTGGLGALWLTYGSTIPLMTGAALSGGFITAMKAGSEFAYQLTFVKALSGETAESIASIGKAALSLSKNSMYGPVELANGLRILSQAGLSATDSLLALPQAMSLATVGEMNMEQAAITLTGVMNAFNLGVGDMAHIGDVFAKAAALSQTSVQGMTEAMKTASVVGEQYGASMEDTATALTLLAKVNISGTAAGTALRNMLKELYSPTAGAAKVIKQLGLETKDAMGNMKSFPEIIYQLKGILAGYDKASQVNILQALFGERGAKEAIAMLGKTKDQWDELNKSISESDGFMRKVSAELESTASGMFKQAFNTMQANLVGAFDRSEGAAKELAVALRDLADSAAFKDSINAIVEGVSKLATVLVEATPMLIRFGEAWLLWKGVGLVVGGINMAAGAIRGLGVTMAIVSAEAALAGGGLAGLRAGLLAAGSAAGVVAGATGVGMLSRVLSVMTSPITAVVVGLGGLAYAINEYVLKMPAAVDAANTFVDSLDRESKKLREEIELLEKKNRLQLSGKSVDTNAAEQELANIVKNRDDAIARKNDDKLSYRERFMAEREYSAFVEAEAKARGKLRDLENDQIRYDAANLTSVIQTGRERLKDIQLDADAAKKKVDTSSVEALLNAYEGKKLSGSDIRAVQKELDRRLSAASQSLLGSGTGKWEAPEKTDHSAQKDARTLFSKDIASESKIAKIALDEKLIEIEQQLAERTLTTRGAIDAKNKATMDSLVSERAYLLGKYEEANASGDKIRIETALNAVEEKNAEIQKEKARALLESTKYTIAQNDALNDISKSSVRYSEDLQDEISYLGKTALEVRKLRIEKQRLRDIQDIDTKLSRNAISADEAKALKEQADARAKLDDAEASRQMSFVGGWQKAYDENLKNITDMSKRGEEAFKMMSDSMSDALATFVSTGKLNFSSLANSIISDIIKMQARAASSGIMGSLGNWIGSFFGESKTGLASLPSSVNTAFPNANGGVYSSPSLHAYANQIHDTPKFFAFAQGGVFGEAGPEAIMPLKRGPDGKLGVQATAAGNKETAVTVNVINNSGAQTKQSERPDGRGGKIIDILIEQVEAKIAGNISTGNGPVPTALQSSYGLNRTAGAY